ncbi:hypothetical protein HOG16_05090 [Candidatus Woesearchaeota archaeon]|nr:hypothetical protein [Candidatus Woesearchaeota archaeon]
MIKESNCKNPNIAIHELLHVLGFEHSLNRNNIMYNITNCDQIIGPDIFELIDNVYVAESLPDLLIEKVSANLEGKYLSTNISIRNIGLKDASDSKLIIFVDGKQIEEVEIESMQMGYGRVLMFSNIWISQLRIDEIEYEIRTEFSELDKKNNKIEIKIGDD